MINLKVKLYGLQQNTFIHHHFFLTKDKNPLKYICDLHILIHVSNCNFQVLGYYNIYISQYSMVYTRWLQSPFVDAKC